MDTPIPLQTLPPTQRRAAKERLALAMSTGLSWRAAAAQIGIQTNRGTARRLYRRWRCDGAVAFADGRHGHPSKLTTPMRQWLLTFCQQAPTTSGVELQAAIAAQFGVQLSIGYLNRVRASLGVRAVRPPKKQP